MIPTPKEIIARLDRSVIGQVRAKRDLATAVYNHYLGQAYASSAKDSPIRDFGSHHVLLLGPTGTGKTAMVRRLATLLEVPVAFCTATSLVEAGYRGQEIESIVSMLRAAAGAEPAKAQRGIIFLDEIDKIRRRDTGGQRDVSGEGVQNGLLTLLDGRKIDGIDTSKLLFIAAGAFTELENIIARRLGTAQRRMGFHNQQVSPDAAPTQVASLADRLKPEDLVAFGFIPEFIGRFGVVTAVEPLGVADLRRILTDADGSVVARQQALFRVHGIDLEFEAGALDAIAANAAAAGTGARGLNRAVLQAVDAVDWQLPDLAREGVIKVVVTAETIRSGAEPRIERGMISRPAADELERLRGGGRGSGVAPAGAPDKAAAKPPSTTAMRPTPEQMRRDIEVYKKEKLGWEKTDGAARRWWETFEQENRQRPEVILRLCEELAQRGAVIHDLFQAFLYSNTDNIQANLHYMDYMRIKKGGN